MSQSVPASSTSTNHLLQEACAAAVASARALFLERFQSNGIGGYVLVWAFMPFFSLVTVGLIYGSGRSALVAYSVVGVAASAFIFNTLYFIGELLDEERMRGTLLPLFLAPCPRAAWLTGFSAVGFIETGMAAFLTVLLGRIVFNVRLNPNVPAFLLSFLLFLLSLWGLGLIFSGLGLILKRSNDLSNLVNPFLTLLGGVYYPVSLLPLPLQVPARALPIGYGVQAMANSLLHNASVSHLLPDLLPLLGFALALPTVGILLFARLEHAVRVRGELDLY